MRHLLVLCLLQVRFAPGSRLILGSSLFVQEHQIDVLVLNSTDNQASSVTSRRVPSANVTTKKRVEAVAAPRTAVAQTRQIIRDEIWIASTSKILIGTLVVAAPLIVAWCIYIYIYRGRTYEFTPCSDWISLIVFPVMLVVALVATARVPMSNHDRSVGNGLEVAARLNNRYRAGRPSNTLEEAGLLIHVFDTYDNVEPWGHSFPDLKALWDPGLRCNFPLSYATFHKACDRVSASVFNAEIVRGTSADLFSSAPGIVLAPTPAAKHVLCSYPIDGGSDAVVCDVPGGGQQCRPGCYNVNKCHCHVAGSQSFGDNETIFRSGFMYVDDCKVPVNPVWGPNAAMCSFGPSRLDVMMQKQMEILDRTSTPRWLQAPKRNASLQTDAYTWGLKGNFNEVVLGTRNPSWSGDMIEALFIQDSSSCKSRKLALSIHDAMMDAGMEVPLLGLDLSSSRPFAANIISPNCGTGNALLYSSLAIACSIFVFFRQRHGIPHASHVVLSVTGMTMFGISNFLMGQAGRYLANPFAHVHMTFIMGGFIAYIAHVICWYSAIDYRSSLEAAVASPVRVHLYVVAAGLMIALDQLCACISFDKDHSNSGANQALACLSVIMVSVFFYFHSGEQLTAFETMAYILILLGSLIISGVVFDLRLPSAVTWMFFSTLANSISIITLRLSSIAGGSDFLRMVVIYLIVGTVALLLLPFVGPALGVHEFLDKPSALFWPFLNACAELLGMWSVICAYDLPWASVSGITAVVDSNCMVMLIMNFVCDGARPGYDRIVGVVLVLVGQGINVLRGASCTKIIRSAVEDPQA